MFSEIDIAKLKSKLKDYSKDYKENFNKIEKYIKSEIEEISNQVNFILWLIKKGKDVSIVSTSNFNHVAMTCHLNSRQRSPSDS